MKVHTFDNGVKVFEAQLLAGQKERYLRNNLHEPEEEAIFLRVIRRLNPGDSFINIGAAIGYYAILAKLQRPDLRVHAYEPLRMHRRYIRRNLKLNGLVARDVEIHKEGVDRADGFATFRNQDYSSAIERGSSGLSRVGELLQKLRGQRISTISLESAIGRCDGPVGLVSMDIQGAEIAVVNASLDVIQSMRVEHYLIGTHGPGIHKDIVDALERCGYTIVVNELAPDLQPDGIVLAQKQAEQSVSSQLC